MQAEVVKNRRETYTVVLFPSTSNPSTVYRVDVVNQRCSCPAWKFAKGERKLCKHLKALGFKPERPTVEEVQARTGFKEVL